MKKRGKTNGYSLFVIITFSRMKDVNIKQRIMIVISAGLFFIVLDACLKNDMIRSFILVLFMISFTNI